MLPELSTTISKIKRMDISAERKVILRDLIDYIQDTLSSGNTVNLIFICTHNSRRSQFSQVWAQTAAYYFGIPASCYSGGVEVTSFNERAIASLRRCGFRISQSGNENPEYLISHSLDGAPIRGFSKLFNHPILQARHFAAVMTCSHADETCPYIPGTEKRISVPYDDPKEFDDTPQEASQYDARCLQIASEMWYVFSSLKI